MGAGDEARTAHCDALPCPLHTLSQPTLGAPTLATLNASRARRALDKPHGGRATYSRIKVHGMVYTAAG